jgi:transglutaminase-like putative cysteine protease
VYEVRHATRYTYDAPVIHAHHFCHLRPRQFVGRASRSTELTVDPPASVIRRSVDYFGNQVHLIELSTNHDVLEVTSSSVVEVTPHPEAPRGGISWDETAERLRAAGALVSALEFCFDSPLVRAHHMLAAYAQPSFSPGRSLVDAILEFNRRIFEEFQYETTATDISTPSQVLRERRGVRRTCARCGRMPAFAGLARVTFPATSKRNLLLNPASSAPMRRMHGPRFTYLAMDGSISTRRTTRFPGSPT